MTIDDDDTTGGRLAQDTVKIEFNGRFLTQFTVSRPMTFAQKLAIIRKVWSLL